jgi:hypothetical protein
MECDSRLEEVLSLPALVEVLDPATLLHLQQTCRAQWGEADSLLASWYWRTLILNQLPEQLPLRFSGAPNNLITQARLWRQVFLDYDSAFTNSSLLITDEDYRNFHTKHVGVGVPPDVVFQKESESPESPVSVCQLDAARNIGGDRIVVSGRPFPRIISCTASKTTSSWDFSYKLVQGYFEVTVEKPAKPSIHGASIRSPCVSIGVCTPHILPNSVMHKQVGWCTQSWGLHSDDGGLYHASGTGLPFCPYGLVELLQGVKSPTRSKKAVHASFEVGDTIGCGMLVLPGGQDKRKETPFRRAMFFTKNGRFLGVAFVLFDDPWGMLHPCVGIDAHWLLRFNFGAKPYQFDVESLGHIGVARVGAAMPTTPTSKSYFPPLTTRLALTKEERQYITETQSPRTPTSQPPKYADQMARRIKNITGRVVRAVKGTWSKAKSRSGRLRAWGVRTDAS